jgi:predicted Abi (CAAX) family protease
MSILKDQKVNWIPSQDETKKVEDKKVMTNKERLKMITAVIIAQQTINEKCRLIYESKPTSELYSIIVMNDVNLTALEKIKTQNES